MLARCPETSQLAIKAAAQLSIEVVAVTAMTDNITNTHTHTQRYSTHTHTAVHMLSGLLGRVTCLP